MKAGVELMFAIQSNTAASFWLKIQKKGWHISYKIVSFGGEFIVNFVSNKHIWCLVTEILGKEKQKK